MGLVITVFFSSIIGYITNVIAIKMLFWPKKEILHIQGLLIKRKPDLAKSISDLVVTRLLGTDFSSDLVASKLSIFISDAAKSLVNTIADYSKVPDDSVAITVMEDSIKIKLASWVSNSKNISSLDVDSIKSIVYENIMAIPDQEIEKVLYDIAAREFRAIEIIGAIIGAGIGIINYYIGVLL